MNETIKPMMIAMLLGMGLLAAPQAAVAESSVFATYELPLGLQFGKPPTEQIKPYLQHTGDVYTASSVSRTGKEYMNGYLKGNLGVQTRRGVVVSVIFFGGKYPKVMRGLLSHGMSAEKLKQLLREQGAQEIGFIPPKRLGMFGAGFITAVFGSYQYAFNVESSGRKKTGLVGMEILEYFDDY